MMLVPGDYLWCRRSVKNFLVCYEEKNYKINRHASRSNYLKQHWSQSYCSLLDYKVNNVHITNNIHVIIQKYIASFPVAFTRTSLVSDISVFKYHYLFSCSCYEAT